MNGSIALIETILRTSKDRELLQSLLEHKDSCLLVQFSEPQQDTLFQAACYIAGEPSFGPFGWWF